MVLQRHNAAASRKAAGWRDEGLPQRCRRRAGCRSVWKRHDDERHRECHFRDTTEVTLTKTNHRTRCKKCGCCVLDRPQTAHLYFQQPESTPC